MIEAEQLTGLPGIAHGFFTREGGVSEGVYAGLNCGPGSNDDPDKVRENRTRAAARLGLVPSSLVSLYQVHSPNAVTVTEPWGEDRPQADGMATRERGIALGILTADCAPVLFADSEAQVIGAAHAGWRGAVGGVLEATIAEMESLGAHRATITAVVGPAISQANYEVGPELREQVMAATPGAESFFTPSDRADHFRFDLEGYAVARLTAAGVGRVAGLATCTYADEARFFSFRRTTHRNEPDYGRQISAICLTP